jgi:cell division protein FtsI (penicillin-binding protein 3)
VSRPAQGLVRLPVWRARLVLMALAGGFAVLMGRAVYLQAVRTDFLQEKGDARYSRVLAIPATRGRILDRNGEALAVSTPVKSVWAIPADVEASGSQRRKLAALLSISPRELEKKISDTSKDFVYLKRQVPPETAAAVQALGLKGIYEHPEYRRYYPGGEVTAHVIGFTGVDDTGQEGIELAHQATLGGKPGSRRVIRDRLGRIVEDVESIRSGQDGSDLALSIDSKIQSLAYGALKAAVERHRAKAGAVIAVDVRSGEVLALANVPSYNPNNRARLTGAQLRNRVITDLFEPGSTLKPFTVAAAIETGKVSRSTLVNTAPGSLSFARYTIRDVHPAPALTVADVLARSSNVGAARIALDLPREAMWDLYRRVGFGAAPELGFPGAAAGRLRHYKTWRPVEQATLGYGMGISLSLAQLARAYTVFARDGVGSADAGQNRRCGERGEGAVGRGGARSTCHARAGRAAERYRPARPHHRMACRWQDGYRPQAGERRLRSRQIPLVLRRPCAGERAAPRRGGDDRRTFGRAALRRHGGRAGVRAGDAGRAAPASRAARRTPGGARRRRRSEGEHVTWRCFGNSPRKAR